MCRRDKGESGVDKKGVACPGVLYLPSLHDERHWNRNLRLHNIQHIRSLAPRSLVVEVAENSDQTCLVIDRDDEPT